MGYYHFYENHPKEAFDYFLKAYLFNLGYLEGNQRCSIEGSQEDYITRLHLYRETDGLATKGMIDYTLYNDVKRLYEDKSNHHHIFGYDGNFYELPQTDNLVFSSSAELYICRIENQPYDLEISYCNGSVVHLIQVNKKLNPLETYYQILSEKGHLASQLALDSLSLKRAQSNHSLVPADQLEKSKKEIKFSRNFLKKNQDIDQTTLIYFLKRILEAEQTNPEYSFALGLGYFYQEPMDQAQAFFYVYQAAERNFPRAFLFLGIFYTRGIHVEKDPNQAFFYYQLAAQHGSADAQALLSYCYKNGIGTVIDVEQSEIAHRLAKNQHSTVSFAGIKDIFEDSSMSLWLLF